MTFFRPLTSTFPTFTLRATTATSTSTFCLLGVLAGGVAVVSTPVQAAPTSNLTFNLNARVAPTSSNAGFSGQTLQARVLLHGNRTRVETTFGGQKSVTLVAPPYIYRLLPTSKAGVRWKMDGSRKQSMGGLGLDPQELVRNPGKIRALLTQNGAKRVSSSTLNGTPVDVYAINKTNDKLSNAKAYLRKSDGLPLRLEAEGTGLRVTAVWSNYARPQNLPASLFRAPQGYKIRDAKSAPPAMMF